MSFPDVDGTPRRLDDPAFAGDARLLVVFGSWCPNCNDLSEYLVELDARYEGLSILGLAFEYGDDPVAQRAAVRDYLAHHGASYPALVCGTVNKEKASAALPILDRVRAYPTTVFMDGQGRVSAVHTGFSGPPRASATSASANGSNPRSNRSWGALAMVPPLPRTRGSLRPRPRSTIRVPCSRATGSS